MKSCVTFAPLKSKKHFQTFIMKKVLSLVAVAGMFAFASCESNKVEETTTTEATETTVTEEVTVDSAAVIVDTTATTTTTDTTVVQ